MIFLENKYRRWYQQLIDRASARPHSNGMERHHIIPKSMGGSNAKENLVSLTYREHFLAHWLLSKSVSSDYRLVALRALACMSFSRTGRIVSSLHFAITRAARSEGTRGQPSPLKGKPKSPETRAKMSAEWHLHRGADYTEKLRARSQERMRTPEAREAQRKRATNLSDETRARRSASATGRVMSDDAKRKTSAAMKGHKRCVGRVLSAETKAKIGAASRARWASLRGEA